MCSRLQFVRLCSCGCGQPTRLATQTNSKNGHVLGQPHRFLMGHSLGRPVGRDKYANGYKFIYLPWHPAAKSGYMQEHRAVVEQAIGRYLCPEECVHHRNGVKDDNRLTNLQVMTNAEHSRLHGMTERWSRKYDACVRCGTDTGRYGAHGLCHRCDSNKRYHERETA